MKDNIFIEIKNKTYNTSPGGRALRANMPREVVASLKLEAGDYIKWKVVLRDNVPVVVVEKAVDE
ncbi:MAG: hypothetical protein LBB45_03345 [Methanobrevibacter sp.]|jgi:hypothetical protein|nr:hypothetical protein [Candidatus Methanovirga basalitermitum]